MQDSLFGIYFTGSFMNNGSNLVYERLNVSKLYLNEGSEWENVKLGERSLIAGSNYSCDRLQKQRKLFMAKTFCTKNRLTCL